MSTKYEWLKKHWKKIVWPLVLVALGVGGYFTQEKWMPHAERFMALLQNKKEAEPEPEETSPGETPDTLTLSPTAWKNIGLTTGTVKPVDFTKVVSVPAMVVERQGRSQINITAPMTGVVTQVYPLARQAVEPGTTLFDMRLTHEDVVSAQTTFLTNLQNLDVVNQELARLQNIGEGVIPGKRLIEQKYERDKVQAALAATRQSLLLHGMSEQQVADMESTRKVLREITVVTPAYAKNHEHEGIEHKYQVQSINVNRGESVAAGQLMAVLADHCLLYIEGKAFENDSKRLVQAAKNGSTIQVVPASGNYETEEVLNLKVQSVANEVEQQSRALKFYLLLPNELTSGNDTNSSQIGFVSWKYRPGQRMEARIPTTDVMKNKIVLPPDAVVIDGPNAFVFEQNGDNFDRVDVQVLYRDKDSVVLENDGQLVGSSIAMNGAYQMHLALKNASGGAIDPHAGHNH
jgi:multidrug efflux pump subunit AcrA (membrane-fusion protein)